jgi:hypothetical protein
MALQGLRNYVQFTMIILLCLQMAFVGQVYHAGYRDGKNDCRVGRLCKSNPASCMEAALRDSELWDEKNTSLKSSWELKSKKSFLWYLSDALPPHTSLPTWRLSNSSGVMKMSAAMKFFARGMNSTAENKNNTNADTHFSVDSDYPSSSEGDIAPVHRHRTILLDAFTRRNEALEAIRDFHKSPIIFSRNEARTHDQCDVGCREEPAQTQVSGLTHLPSSQRDGLKADRFTIAQTMESASNYPAFHLDSLKNNGDVDITSTTSLRSDVPAVYGGWHLFNMTEELDIHTTKRENAAVAFVSNCGSQFRIDAMSLLRENGVPVHNYGSCQRTHEETTNPNTQVNFSFVCVYAWKVMDINVVHHM